MQMKLVNVIRATNGKHKFTAVLEHKGYIRHVNFGAKGYSDYTKHKDPERKRRYLPRHASRENWTASGVLTAGFWSRWILWNLPDLKKSISFTKKRFRL
jgi:hypothetical protein